MRIKEMIIAGSVAIFAMGCGSATSNEDDMDSVNIEADGKVSKAEVESENSKASGELNSLQSNIATTRANSSDPDVVEKLDEADEKIAEANEKLLKANEKIAEGDYEDAWEKIEKAVDKLGEANEKYNDALEKIDGIERAD